MTTSVRPRQALNLAEARIEKLKGLLANEYLLVAAIVVISAALRFYRLGGWSFWGDEFITVRRALRIFEAPLIDRTLSLLTTNLFLSLAGISEWSARAEAAVVGVLTVPVLYLLVRRVFGPAVALMASVLLSVSPWHLYWSQNARFYTALLLFFSLALFLFHYALEEDRRRYFALSAVFLVLAMQERMVAAILLVILAGYIALLVLLRFPRPAGLRARNLIPYYGVSVLAMMALVLANTGFTDPDQFQTAFGFANNSPFWIVGGVAFYVGLPLVCAAAAGGAYLLLQKRREGLLLMLAATVPVLAIAAISIFQYTANRYAFVALTSIITLGAVGLKELLWQAPRNTRLVAAGFAAVLLLAPMGDNLLYFQYQNGNRDNWKDAFALIASAKHEGDAVMTTQQELADYYLGESTLRMQRVDIEAYAATAPRTWFIIDLTTRPKAPRTYHWILANAQLVASLDVSVSARTFPMRIYLYDPERPPVVRGNAGAAVQP
jgi:mannosyltransferase